MSLSYKERKWDSRKHIMLVYYGVLHALVTMAHTNKILGKAVIVVKELHGF